MAKDDTRSWITHWAFRGLVACACTSASISSWLATRLFDSMEKKVDKNSEQIQQLKEALATMQSDVRHHDEAIYKRGR